ncbi:MAG: hypothetical protein JWM20_629 [Patescibacteria group bacterium]|nr:hypothetical protein [Patescibacteria group bacterium]
MKSKEKFEVSPSSAIYMLALIIFLTASIISGNIALIVIDSIILGIVIGMYATWYMSTQISSTEENETAPSVSTNEEVKE